MGYRGSSDGSLVSSISDWVERHMAMAVLVVVALGFVLRLVCATKQYFNPDEALHYLIANQAGLDQVYRASLTTAHPPLFFMLLYFWRFLGNSELVLRLISVLAGTAGLWVGFNWLAYRSGTTTGLVGLLLLAFNPTMISMSAEVRGYATLLLTMMLALYYLERALREKSRWMLLWFGVAALVANLIHYSAVWFTIAVGLYALVRIVRERLPGRWVGAWVAIQAGIAALLIVLYLTHVRTIHGSGMERYARDGWLQEFYFHPGRDKVLPFLARNLSWLFTYLFWSRVPGLVALGLFLAGVVTLFVPYRRKPDTSTRNQDRRWVEDSSFGVLIVAAFVVNALAALAGLYAFGYDRHDVFLGLFAVAGVSSLFGRMAGRRSGAVLLAFAVIVPMVKSTSASAVWDYKPEEQSRAAMGAAIRYIKDSIPRASILFVDCQTADLLGYYLGRDQIDSLTVVLQRDCESKDQFPSHASVSDEKFTELSYGGYRVFATPLCDFVPLDFCAELEAMKQRYGLGPTVPVWGVGWKSQHYSDSLLFDHAHAFLRYRAFDPSLSVFQVQ
ncbi:MAG TPA: glycosyltransferase family 39 protein [bacterium]|nr:glycosyltransferase family 39 protein [bacterium]